MVCPFERRVEIKKKKKCTVERETKKKTKEKKRLEKKNIFSSLTGSIPYFKGLPPPRRVLTH